MAPNCPRNPRKAIAWSLRVLIWQQVEIPAAFQRQVHSEQRTARGNPTYQLKKAAFRCKGMPVSTSHSNKEITLVAHLVGSPQD